MTRPYDLVLFGATGFTGKLVAEYLAAHTQGLVWAVAGRNEAKLREVIGGLGAPGKKLGLFLADSGDAEALSKIAKAARVVITTVGPYAKYGLPLAHACAKAGTHYVDITGEVPFVRASIDQNHTIARDTGARIVHCCGFDSIPSDLGVLTLAERARAEDDTLAETRFVLLRAKGGFSGGTAASMLNLMEAAEHDRALRQLLWDPYSLTPDAATEIRVDGPDRPRVARHDREGVWTGPFVMAAVNTRIVRRSNALLGHAYGPRFSYDECMSFGAGPAGLARAAAFTAGLGGALVLASKGPSRNMLARLLPASGEGPSKAERDGGYFRVAIHATTARGKRLRARVEGTSDPGYGETAKMLSESALALLEDSLASAEGGVLTPASALGMPLVTRLRAAGMTFDVD